MSNLQSELKRMIRQVFERESEFIEEFGICPRNIDSVRSFYMASEQCLIQFVYVEQINTGECHVTKECVIRTDDFLNWINQ